MLTDTHAHIYSEYYDNIEDVIKRASINRVKRIFNCAVDVKTSKEVLDLSKNHSTLLPVIGIHPEQSLNYKIEDIDYIRDNAKNAIAIGEIGLDYHYEGFNKDKQIELFRNMLDIAKSFNKPVIIHSRDAYEDTINILKEYNLKGIIHSFSGSKEIADRFINLGFVLGINGVLTFKNCKLKDTLKSINVNSILLETDSPYLSPEPYRGKQNEPSNVLTIANNICEIYNIKLEELVDVTTVTINWIFDL